MSALNKKCSGVECGLLSMQSLSINFIWIIKKKTWLCMSKPNLSECVSDVINWPRSVILQGVIFWTDRCGSVIGYLSLFRFSCDLQRSHRNQSPRSRGRRGSQGRRGRWRCFLVLPPPPRQPGFLLAAGTPLGANPASSWAECHPPLLPSPEMPPFSFFLFLY